jgi:hypothetical protein
MSGVVGGIRKVPNPAFADVEVTEPQAPRCTNCRRSTSYAAYPVI